MAVNVTVAPTPNPNAMKFSVDKPLRASGSVTYASRAAAEGVAWAQACFQVPGVSALFAMPGFVTVSRESGASWEGIVSGVTAALKANL